MAQSLLRISSVALLSCGRCLNPLRNNYPVSCRTRICRGTTEMFAGTPEFMAILLSPPAPGLRRN